ncbi:unnamed protein product [Rotaria sordida]|uniref:Protein kinase domain-containing protein n=1 Tax=Rotaria sordida TaxID=392033 RepID=A0A814NR60_9BILA|nr:unnamed protein product [Rotaria sordida]CAF1000043.1 unnamed protein product [Rotaria sordida]CAF1093841.1 unnamed protein product [Rotaria sordida]CAF1099740.1 unnamed protein product [Rotaria sordida]CAF3805714.1 unnamed protein product [Rotaria sordida]
MANQSDSLAITEANPQLTIQRKKPQEQRKTLKFELDGQVRACCLSKPFTYCDLLKCIENLFGNHTLSSIGPIQCLLSRNDALRLPITNDKDLKKVLTTIEKNGSNKLNFLLTRKKPHTISRVISINNYDDSGSMSDDGQTIELDDIGLDSPPPGTITPQKSPTITTTNTISQTKISKDGGLFIPEPNDDTYSSGSSSVASRDSSRSKYNSRRHLPTTSFVRLRASSDASSGSGINSSSSSSQTNLNEFLCTPCSCSSRQHKSPQTPTNWKLGRQLGQGAFGKVFVCYDVDTGSELAIKQISIRGLNSETTQKVKILECEINIYKQLDHERIVRYHGALQTDDCLQIFMEFMVGGSVREQILNYGALTDQLTKKYTRQILEGLVYLHENYFVHRDIKCANILRDISGNIKLGDFGTSRRLIAITNQNQPNSGTIGTAHWTAPEIIRGNIFGRKADIWSLGCTIVEMLTTGPPWQNLQPIAAIFHIATSEKPEYKLPENVSSLAREFIDLCLTKDYHQRPTALDLICHPFLDNIRFHHHYHRSDALQ